MKNDPYKDIVWLALLGAVGFGIYWAFQNGIGGTFGMCPAGFTASGGTCVDSESLATPAGGSPPTTPLAAGMQWGWSGTDWMQVPINANWNPSVTVTL
jgi:hypothetical protein